MRLAGTFLRSQLGRRIFLMFGVAVVIPAMAVFWLTYKSAASVVDRTENSSLRTANKLYALSVYGRLEMARITLVRAASSSSLSDPAVLMPIFTRASFLKDPAEFSKVANAPEEAKLTVERDTHGKAIISIAIRIEGASEPMQVTGTLNPDFLWGDPDAAISDGRVCVRSERIELACLGERIFPSSTELVEDQWILFLEPQFDASSWHFEAAKTPRNYVGSFGRLFTPIALGMLLLALLLSSVVIRRILIPLEALIARINAVGGEGSSELVVDADEFATIDRTFNAMEGRISDQIMMLQTLQEIDHLILNRAPLQNIVEVVLERIAGLLGSPPVAFSLTSASGYLASRHLLLLNGVMHESGPQSESDPVGDSGYSLQIPSRDWRTGLEVGPGFSGLGLASVSCLTVGPEEGPVVRLAVGRFVGHVPGLELVRTESLVELAERVAVAVAAELHENRLNYQARHDLLTDLPNRLAVVEELPKLIRRADRGAWKLAIIFIDLDRFKAINDGLGHGLGDSVLVEVSRRIGGAVGPDSLVARIGGDEFLVVCPRVVIADSVFATDNCIREALQAPIQIGGELVTVEFSSGIALYPDDGIEPESLLHNSDLAMYRAKASGGGCAVAFDPEMNQSAVRRAHLENELRQAINAKQLLIHYQPRVDSRTGSIVGAEALVRWNHPVLGLVLPDEFISLAEECGLIGSIGRFVIEEVCHQLAKWKRVGLVLPLVAVNISSHQLRAGDLFDLITDALVANDLSYSELEIEITESVLVKDSAYASEQLQRLRDAGVSVAIDDFGTGYSSLAYLTSLPTDTIKIDRAFSMKLDDPGTQAVVLSIVALGKALGKVLVAEGVETQHGVEILNSWGCHIIQGYVYFPALTVEELGFQLGKQNIAVSR